jgi:hypothetical protein
MGIYPFEDYQNYSPYIHTPNDLIGTSVNSFEMSQQYCQMNIACLAEIANPMGETPQVYCNPVMNFEFAIPIDKEVMELYMIWDAPEEGSTGELQHFDVYRDSAVIATVQYDPNFIHYEYIDTISIGAQAEYFIMAVYSDGCEAPSETLIGEGIPHQLSEMDANSVSVYPNPTENQLNIEAKGLQRVSVYNAMGQLVKTVEVGGQDQFTMEVGNYPTGLYTLRLVMDKGVINKTILVK